MVFVGFLYPFIYLFSNTKCFQLGLNVSTFPLCAPVGRGGSVYSGASASRGTEVLIRTQGEIIEGMLKFVPQGWKGEVSWAWSLFLLVAQWDGCAESASDGGGKQEEEREMEIAGF